LLYPLECDSPVEHLGYQEIAPIGIDGQRKELIKREVDRKQKIYSFTRANRNSRGNTIKIRELAAKQMLARLIRWIAEAKRDTIFITTSEPTNSTTKRTSYVN